MKIEVLIYAYLAICAAMILFNIACVFVFRRRDKKLVSYSETFIEQVNRQIELPEIDSNHRKYLSEKLGKVNNLMAFDETLEKLYAGNPEKIRNYIGSLAPVFIHLILEYKRKNKLKVAYLLYLIKKYEIFRGQKSVVIADVILEAVQDPSLYCRENALQALYSIGNVEFVIKALMALDEGPYYHNAKLITDGLLTFSGEKEKLDELLWQTLPRFTTEMQVAILNYFRFSSGRHCEAMMKLLTTPQQNDEICYSCIRYFGKYHYEPALQYLLNFVRGENEINWEYAAISATSLSAYPSEQTVEVLKGALSSRNWYVRYNAAQSLGALGLDYTDLIDIFEGDDRYAEEMLRYRFDQNKLKEKGVNGK